MQHSIIDCVFFHLLDVFGSEQVSVLFGEGVASTKTRNPIFGETKGGFVAFQACKLAENVEFAPNIDLIVKNDYSDSLSLFKTDIVGSTLISPRETDRWKSIEEFHLNPKFYPVYYNGMCTGNILMQLAFVRKPKKGVFNQELVRKHCELIKYQYTLKFSCIGLRSLDSDFKQPLVRISIPALEKEAVYDCTNRSTKNKVQAQQNIDIQSKLVHKNPNICQILTIEELELPEDMIYWPRVELEFIDQSFLGRRYF